MCPKNQRSSLIYPFLLKSYETKLIYAILNFSPAYKFYSLGNFATSGRSSLRNIESSQG